MEKLRCLAKNRLYTKMLRLHLFSIFTVNRERTELLHNRTFFSSMEKGLFSDLEVGVGGCIAQTGNRGKQY